MTTDHVDSLAQLFFFDTWGLWPSKASREGIRRQDEHLERLNADLVSEQLALCRRVAQQLRQARKGPVPPRFDLASKLLEIEVDMVRFELEVLELWRRDPSYALLLAGDALFWLITSRSLLNLKSTAAVVRRLKAIPDLLQQARQSIRRPVRFWTQVAVEVAEGLQGFIEETAQLLCKYHPRHQWRIRRAATAAWEAVETYHRWLTQEAMRRSVPYEPIGSEELLRIAREWHGYRGTLEDLWGMAIGEIQAYEVLLRVIAEGLLGKPCWRTAIAQGRRRFVRSIRNLYEKYVDAADNTRGLLQHWQLADFVVEEPWMVLETPSYLRPFVPVVEYLAPGCCEACPWGLLLVSVPPPTMGRRQRSQMLGQHFGIEFTVARLIRPGLHTQACWTRRLTGMIWRVARQPIGVEGWGAYCEQEAWPPDLEESPALALEYLRRLLTNAVRLWLDLALNSGEITIQAALKQLRRSLHIPPAVARAEVLKCTRSPGTQMCGVLGRHMIFNLENTVSGPLAGEEVVPFHRYLAQAPPTSPAWLERNFKVDLEKLRPFPGCYGSGQTDLF